MTIDHIGIAVKSLEISIPLYEKMLGTACHKTELVESEGVLTAFFQLGETKVELLQSTDEQGVIARYIEKKGEGMHHIAYAVADIKTEMERMKKEGFQLIDAEPKKGADNKWVCFLHPKGTTGVLTELCQEIHQD
jgi:methylmalonyl-CoA/ethylmalonyl-CoA epimerase